MGEPEDVGSEECWSCRKQRVLSSMGAGGGGGEFLNVLQMDPGKAAACQLRL